MTDRARATDLAEFDQGWLEVLERTPFVRLISGMVGLTRLGERPAPLDRLATIVGQPVNETAELVRENLTTRIEDGLVHWSVPFPGDRTRRVLYVGDRAIPMNSGCAPDLPGYATMLDVPFRVEDTCAATGVPIHIGFVPNGYERVDPPRTVTALLPVGQLRKVAGGNFAQINTTVCTYQPFFASAGAAKGWVADHPGGRVFTVEEMFERPWLIHYRDTLRPLIHH